MAAVQDVATAWWRASFGDKAQLAPIDAFTRHLEARIPTDPKRSAWVPVLVKYVIASNPEQKDITTSDFGNFLARFGQDFDLALKRVKENLFFDDRLASWFHGYAPREETEALIKTIAERQHGDGLFLFRLSNRFPVAITLTYSRIVENKKFVIKTVLVYNMTKGFSLEQTPKPDQIYPTFLQLVESKQLRLPVASRFHTVLYPHPVVAPPAPASSNYAPFNPTQIMTASAPAPAPQTESNYAPFSPALVAAATTSQQQAKTENNYAPFNAVALIAANNNNTANAAAQQPSSYDRINLGNLAIESALSSKPPSQPTAASAAPANSNYVAFHYVAK